MYIITDCKAHIWNSINAWESIMSQNYKRYGVKAYVVVILV
jgi:hypothetical protein